jgi:hypothetical protein
MPEDRRGSLRRVEDIRELLRFCQKVGQSVPRKLVARLEELGIADTDRRPIPQLLDELEAVERPLREALPAERRSQRRRWLNANVEDDAEEAPPRA